MNIVITGKHLDTGASLQTHIEERTHATIAKYLDRINTVHVVISKEGAFFRVDITGNLGTHAGITLNARSEHADVYSAFDAAIEKLGKQLRRYKRQITNHHQQAADVTEKRHKGKYYVISSEEESEVPDNPVIVAEDASHIEYLTVSDAVMRLELGNLPMLAFINQANDRLNMIYRRHDGNVGWIDPHINTAAQHIAA